MVKKSTVSAKSSDEVMQQDPEEFFLCLSSGEEEEVGNDLSYWEFINPSDADDDDDDVDIDIDSLLSLDSHQNGLFISLHSSLSSSIAIPQSNQTQEDQHTHFDEDDASVDHHRQNVVERVAYVGYQYRDSDDDDPEDEGMYGDDDDDDDDGDGYDLDDELVPRSVSGKLGRQRMRKLGKRAFAKMCNSKKSPFLYTKPGCVHGKHGLGLKHSC